MRLPQAVAAAPAVAAVDCRLDEPTVCGVWCVCVCV